LWFTEFGSNQIGTITTAGVVAEVNIPTANSGPTGIAVGRDGALWFTEANANQIGRITTNGTITETGTGITAGSGLAGIASGPDGNLWFAESVGGQIGRAAIAGDLSVTITHNPNLRPGFGITYMIVVSN